MRIEPSRLLRVADLLATFLFAFEGATAGAEAGLDVFGVMVVAFATALGGGIIRDLLIDDVPPAALRSWTYSSIAFLGAGVVIVVYVFVIDFPDAVITPLDAGGLGLFCAVGAAKALDHRMNALMAVLLGTISAVGGGVIRDVLLNKVPTVLVAEIYAVAAAAGAAVTVLCVKRGMPRGPAMALGVLTCVALRLVSVSQNWNLPQVSSL